MKWVTREKVKVDRVACPWLIKKFIDPGAEFLFVPPDQVMPTAEREKATPFDVPGVELGHHNGKCSFEAIVSKYAIDDPAIGLLARIVHGADVVEDLYGRPEAPGLKAIAEGF
ncbi:MAG: chromate resistance protein ChrB domain-containing protein, partial [Sphingomicrobium sp.]